MLLAIVDTFGNGKYLFDKIPREWATLDIGSKMSAKDCAEKLRSYFYYFGYFTKNCVFKAAGSSFSEDCLFDIFSDKRDSVVMGVDEEIVFVSQSIEFGKQEPVAEKAQEDFYYFSVEKEGSNGQSIIKSLTLVWVLRDFEKVECIQNQLCFFLRMLEKREREEKYISAQIGSLLDVKAGFERKIKEKANEIEKDQGAILEEDDVKEIFASIIEKADSERNSIALALLHDLKLFHDAVHKEEPYRAPDGKWEGATQAKYQVSSRVQDRGESLRDFQIIIAEKELKESLPRVLADERVLSLAKKTIEQEKNQSVRELFRTLDTSPHMQRSQLFTLDFLVRNGLGQKVHPFDARKYINLYGIRKMPSWALIEKFKRIFQEHLLEYLHTFRNTRMAELDSKFKFVLQRELLSRITLCVHHLPLGENCPAESNIVAYRLSQEPDPKVLNQLIDKHGESQDWSLKTVMHFIKEQSEKNAQLWGFYRVEEI